MPMADALVRIADRRCAIWIASPPHRRFAPSMAQAERDLVCEDMLMKPTMFAALAVLALAGCESDGDHHSKAMTAGCPADVSQADRYKYPACNTGDAAVECPPDVSEADRYKYPACN